MQRQVQCITTDKILASTGTDLDDVYLLVAPMRAASFCRYTVLMAEVISAQSFRELWPVTYNNMSYLP